MRQQMRSPCFATAGCLYVLLSVVHAGATSLFFSPGGLITSFSVTQLVPAISKSSSGARAVWPGIENDVGDYVFQSVVSDSKGLGSWQFFVEYCCNPNYEAQPYRVYPGDSITSTFTSGSNNYWTDSWTISPGPGSQAQRASGSTGNTYTGASIINKAVLAIEYQNGATWDFGQVQWSSLTITANTNKNFCNSFASTGGFALSVAVGSSSINGASSTCTFSRVTFG